MTATERGSAKVALIAGGGSGIGRPTRSHFAVDSWLASLPMQEQAFTDRNEVTEHD